MGVREMVFVQKIKYPLYSLVCSKLLFTSLFTGVKESMLQIKDLLQEIIITVSGEFHEAKWGDQECGRIN